MDFMITLLFSMVAGIVATAVALFVFGYLFRFGDAGIAMTEIGALAVGIIVLIVSFKKLWS